MQIRNNLKIVAGMAIVIWWLPSCYYDKAAVIYPPSSCDSANVAYLASVVPVLTAKCYSCHSGTAVSGGGIKLDAHSAVVIQVNNGKLVGAINHATGFSAMPQGGAKLSACEIAKIEKWVKAGALNN